MSLTIEGRTPFSNIGNETNVFVTLTAASGGHSNACQVEQGNITATSMTGIFKVVLPKPTRTEVLGRRIAVTKG